jgi:hypothetical protein
MTSAFADQVCVWLAENGVSDPKNERDLEEKREAAIMRRQQQYLQMIPDSIIGPLSSATSKEEAISAFEKGINDTVRRAELYLNLFGCDDGSWNHYSGLDQLLQEDLLPKVAQKHLAKAIRGSVNQQFYSNGAARWLFGEGKWDSLDDRTLGDVLSTLAEVGLSHPREINRRRTFIALREIGGTEARKILRKCFGGQISRKSLRKDEQLEPGGMVSFGPKDGSVPEGISEEVVAALLLAEMGDNTILAEIQSRIKEADEKEKEVLQQAIDILSKSADALKN